METPAPQPRPKLKLSVSSVRLNSFGDPSANPSATQATPGSDGGRKIIIKSSQKSQPPTPAEAPTPASAKTKAGRQTKPTAKLVEASKRQLDDLDDEVEPRAKKVKIKSVKIEDATPTDKPTNIVLKSKAGKPPYHPPGDGYDSEASDREIDPAIEEQFILRMMPGEHCEYIRLCIKDGKFGQPRASGGADIQLKFFEEESRRAVMTVKGQPYAAVLVDLPTITEAMKTWDRKALVKSADICQMLLVFQKVKTEDEAKKIPLPGPVQPGFKWPHGLTPPMHDCVNRRFAKVISRKEIEDKEAEVERLLAADRSASGTKWEWLDDRRQKSVDESEDEEDADGEMDDTGYFPAGAYEDAAEDEDDDLEAQLVEELLRSQAEAAASPATQLDGVTPAAGEADTPAAQDKDMDAGDSGDDRDEDDDEDDEDDEGREKQGIKEDIAELRRQIRETEEKAKKEPSPILRKRLEEKIRTIKVELQLKLSHFGDEEE